MNDAVTEDFFLDGRVRLHQPRKGFRAGVDSVLLGAAIEADAGAELMEAGCGVGAALLCAAARLPEVRFVGVERDTEAVRLARENVAINAMDARVAIEEGDALAMTRTFDGVFLNPPYDDANGAQAPHPTREGSYLTETALSDWIGKLSNLLRGGAALTLIHRATRLDAILAALDGRLGGVEILPIRPYAEAPAKRLLVRARKGSRAPLKLYRGLDLHDANGGKYTSDTAAILRGETAVAWR